MNLSVPASNNQNEARFQGNQSIESNTGFDTWVYVNFPSASTAVRNPIINNVYPPQYDRSLSYTSPQQRSDLAVKEYLISCNTVSIAQAYQNKTHSYVCSIPPAIHAQDLAYTYYPNAPTPDFYPQVFKDLQGYVTHLTLTGDPNKEGFPQWPEFGQDEKAINFTVAGIQHITSDAANSRCALWNQATYFPEV